jgi:PrtD family type I secretion system ABC transporter
LQKTELHSAIGACRGSLVVVLCFSFVINLLMLTSPLYMMQVFDHVLGSHSVETLILLTLIAGAALAAHVAIDTIRSQVLSRLGTWLDARLGPVVLARSINASLKTPGRVTSEGLRDLGTIRNFLTGPAIGPLMDAPWSPIFLLALFVLHPVLGVIGVAGGVVLAALALVNECLTRGPLRESNLATGRNLQRTDAALRNVEVIRAMGMTQGIIGRWRRDTTDAVAVQERASGRAAVILGISKYARMLIQTLIMAAGAYLVVKQELASGAMIASSILLGRALSPVENAIGSWRSLVVCRVAFRRLGELLSKFPGSSAGMVLPRPTGRVSVERLSFIPPGGDAPSLVNVSFQLAPGEALGLLGPSAAGKSTLARLMVGAWSPTTGNVRLDGADVSVWHDAAGSRHLGYLPQDIELFGGSVRENIARLNAATPEEVIEAADRVGLHETIMRLPKGYDTEIGEAGFMLSGGQRQRLGLARAIFGKPRFVVLDEPNSSLDFEGEEALSNTLDYLKSIDTTVVVIAHRQSILARVDKLMVLRRGGIEAFGTRDDVFAQLNHQATRPALATTPSQPSAIAAA